MPNEIKFKKILITGGAGFIGSNLTEAFLRQDNQIIVLDNFSTGHHKNIQSFLSHSNFQLIEGDIRNEVTCQEACKGVDYIFHQAALGSVPRSINDPLSTAEVNELGFLKLLIAARDAKVKRFIYAASSSTYGDSLILPKVEDKIGKPLSPYAITKYTNELYANNFSSLYNIETIGLRYFNVFGRRQDPEGSYAAVIPRFCMQLMKHEQPTINGDGSHSRDFTYIDNVIQMNQLAALTNNPLAVNQVYNTACGNRINLNEMISVMKQELGKFDSEVLNIKPIYGPNRTGDILHSHADITKAKELLGYNPSHTFSEGVKEAVEWYFNNLR